MKLRYGIALVLAVVVAPYGFATMNRRSFRLIVARAEAGRPARLEVTVASETVIRASDLRAWRSTLNLFVDGQPAPVGGKHFIQSGKLVFESSFGLVGGTRYRATFAPYDMPLLTRIFTIPVRPRPAAGVERVYPSANAVPANLLKFYVLFTQPMREGQGFEQFALLDHRGRHVPEPFKEVELWNADSKRLTLYLHPGRIKRGVGLNEELGPILQPNRRYTLLLRANFKDATGQPMATDFRHAINTTAPDRTQPLLAYWKLQLPRPGTRAALLVHFGEPLDFGLAQRVIRVEQQRGARVAGRVQLRDQARAWHFTPAKPWEAGQYRLVAEPELEDLVGNNLVRPFETVVGQQLAPPVTRKEFELR